MAADQRVTSDKKQIPPHFVPMASYGCHNGPRKATREYRALNDAWQQKKLSGWKLMATPQDTRGRVYVDPVEAATILESLGEVGGSVSKAQSAQNVSSPQSDAAVLVLCECNNHLSAIGDTLRDLVAAVQLIAEQQSKQHEPVGTWRDMNGEAL